MIIKDNEMKKKILNALNSYKHVTMFIHNLPEKESSELGKDFDDALVDFCIKGDELQIYYEAINVDYAIGKSFVLSDLEFEVYREGHHTIVDMTSKNHKLKIDFERIYVSFTNDYIGDSEIDELTLNELLEKLSA